MAETPWRVTADGERQWRGADSNWYSSEALALEAGSVAPLSGAPAPPVKPFPGIYRRPSKVPTAKGRVVDTTTKLFRVAALIWLLGVFVAFGAGGVGWGVFVLVAGLGLSLGVAKAVGDNANKISNVGSRASGGLQCPKCGGSRFRAKRSAGGKLGLGLLAPKTRVKCETCGTQYTRG
jgi:hypothetical protein